MQDAGAQRRKGVVGNERDRRHATTAGSMQRLQPGLQRR
jgi:hypothetical protein